MKIFPDYKYRGAAALVALHEIHIKNFLNTWKESVEKGIKLPITSDPDYESLDSLLFHVLRSAGNYMIWICRNLNLPDPEIMKVPPIEEVRISSDQYLKHLIDKWKTPLKEVQEERFNEVFVSNLGVAYSIEAMLEHAVMHPIRHEFQLRNLIEER